MKLLVPLRMAWIDSIWLAVRRLADGGDDGDAAAHGRLEGDRAAQLPRRVEQLRPVLGQQGLVGRDHVLAAFQQLQHDGPGGLQPADQLDRRHDLRIVESLRPGRRSACPAAGRSSAAASGPGRPRGPVPAACPTCRAMRSPCSSSSRATPEPMVPNPIMATLAVFMSDVRIVRCGVRYRQAGL